MEDNNNITTKVDAAIKTLMANSFWGKNASINSLSLNLQNEIDEFLNGCASYDIDNSIEEAADIFMIVLCMLSLVNPSDSTLSVEDVMKAVVCKLNRRYQPIYNGIEMSKEAEYSEWESAKKLENYTNYMFCDNPQCDYYQMIGKDNILRIEKKYRCAKCGKFLSPSKDNTLFFNRRKRKYYWEKTREAIVNYSKGESNVPLLMINEDRALADCLVKEVIHPDLKMRNCFINFVSEKLQLDKETIVRFCDELLFLHNSQNILQFYLNYIEDNCNAESIKTNRNLWKNINKELKSIKMDVEKKIEKIIKFNARSWNNEIATKYLLRYRVNEKDHVLECMSIIHFLNDEVNDLTIELSNMYNCVVGCSFCSSAALPESVVYLSPLDYVRQLNTCINESGIDPNGFEHFYVSFAGIGEPSCVYESIAEGMEIIKDMYPHVQFNIATFGFDYHCFEYWRKRDLPIRTLQLPLYSTEDETLRKIVRNLPTDYSLKRNISLAIDYSKDHPECRIKVNYLVMKGINDSESDVLKVIDYLSPFKDYVTIKVSFLNYTRPGKDNNLFAPDAECLARINNLLSEKGFSSYLFGTAENTELGCGQLVQNYISSNKEKHNV